MPISQDEITRKVVNDIYYQAREVLRRLSVDSKPVEPHFAKMLALQLVPFGYYATASAKDILRDFGSPIEMIAWRKLYQQAIAILVEHGMTDERIVSLDQFQPTLAFPEASLIKIMIMTGVGGGVTVSNPSSPVFILQLLGDASPLQDIPAATMVSYAIDDDQPF